MRIGLATSSDVPDWEVDDRPLHRALEEAGARVCHPVWNDPEVDWAGFDGVLIRTTWDYHLHRDEFVAWAEGVEATTLLLNSASVVRWNTHKSYLRRLAEAGLATVETLWLPAGGSVDLRGECEARGWTRAFIKPQVGATARGTLRFDVTEAGLASARAHVARMLPEEGLMVQPYIESVETHGELSAIFVAGEYTHGVRKIPLEGDYRVQDDHGASDEPYSFSEGELASLREFIASSPDDLLYVRFDLLRHPDGSLRLIEMEGVEPSLFFRHSEEAAPRLAAALLTRVRAAAANRD